MLILSAAYLYENYYLKKEISSKLSEVKTFECASPADNKSFNEIYGLSDREKDVLSHILMGLTANETAQKLCITERTVKAHLSAIYRKTGARNRIDLYRIISGQDTAEAKPGKK